MRQELIRAFIKAVDKKYSSNFINEGEIYLNTVSWFRKYEKVDPNIGDSFEDAVLACARGVTLEIKLAGEREFTKVTDNLQNFRMHKNDVKACLFCLYSVLEGDFLPLKDGTHEYTIEPDFIKEYSDRDFFIITNTNEFRDRIFKELRSHENVLCVIWDMVKYYELDEKVKRLSPFNKRNKYMYQKEYRLYITLKKDEPLLLKLGDLNNIAEQFIPQIPHKFIFNLK